MHHYIKCNAAGTPVGHISVADPLEGYNAESDSAVNGKGYLVPATLVDSSLDPATQVKTGPAYNLSPAQIVFTVADKTLAGLKAQRAAEARSEADRRVSITFPLLDAYQGFAKAILQLHNGGAGGGTVGAGILSGIQAIDDLKGFRAALLSAIDGMNAAQLKALDVTDDAHWTA